MGLTLYNDLTRCKEEFMPLIQGKVGFYVCGPTVYDFIHIGNARPFVVFDVLRRYMEHKGLEVIYVQNFTDIDDKMINKANELGISVEELAERFINAYFEDIAPLGVKRATVHPLATKHIDEIIDLISRIMENGHAYVTEGNVYFDVKSFPEYGKLSGQSIEELQAGARIEVDVRKRHPLDFVLWKAQKAGEPWWDSPWGPGRPGWHIECSAMAMKYLGETVDIHGGGSDLIFPHHENEIAQAEAATGKQFVRYWVHNGYLLINKEKMSKSLGNILTVREIIKKYQPLAVRLFILGAHYRSPLDFSDESLTQATRSLQRLRNCYSDLMFHLERSQEKDVPDTWLNDIVDEGYGRFCEALDDDCNTAAALGVVFEVVRELNNYLKENVTPDKKALINARKFFATVEDIMGIIGTETILAKTEEIPSSEIERLIKERDEARKMRDFARADSIRNELADRGIILEDTPFGTRWKRKE
ncbi:MAG: cysteine--tRNA ligase [Acetomicrobium sp.]|jgi:cysteinyl-tRNA synthetase|uniref:cysteine--tRNA ligase n=1 Tax=Acetomicrobium TaxID=49894 RepID=UPI00169C296B|nr:MULTISPECIES: cysteine--tRNA ligase [Acetomicrobium]MDI9377909.1 cysteine--tRNA ligase [Synergistota bacterium]NLI42540.1 cysteine--tRNA ligase [Synergistaceae bacterium]MBP8674679.1 cysteine--tRNA ligase [Acetomicrobium sp.]MDR9770763.1 cysteine--tRNA ligase [Acetomicrobium sp.]HOB10341.1 cysteine--tRNA ligase [Acetomicrobium sp.]